MLFVLMIPSAFLTAVRFVTSLRRRRQTQDDMQVSLSEAIVGLDKDLQANNKEAYRALVAEVQSLRTMQRQVKSQLEALRAIAYQSTNTQVPEIHPDTNREKPD